MAGRPAGRLMDAVAHPISPVLTGGTGALTVFVGGQPAWRAISPSAVAGLQTAQQIADAAIRVAENAATMSGVIAGVSGGADVHFCLTPWPLPPHGAGVDIQGSPTLLCAGLRIARQGDQLLAPGHRAEIHGGTGQVLSFTSGTPPDLEVAHLTDEELGTSGLPRGLSAEECLKQREVLPNALDRLLGPWFDGKATSEAGDGLRNVARELLRSFGLVGEPRVSPYYRSVGREFFARVDVLAGPG